MMLGGGSAELSEGAVKVFLVELGLNKGDDSFWA